MMSEEKHVVFFQQQLTEYKHSGWSELHELFVIGFWQSQSCGSLVYVVIAAVN